MPGLSNRSNPATRPQPAEPDRASLPASAGPTGAGDEAIDVEQLRVWISSVSFAEAVSNLMSYQWASQASARLATTIDQMQDSAENVHSR